MVIICSISWPVVIIHPRLFSQVEHFVLVANFLVFTQSLCEMSSLGGEFHRLYEQLQSATRSEHHCVVLRNTHSAHTYSETKEALGSYRCLTCTCIGLEMGGIIWIGTQYWYASDPLQMSKHWVLAFNVLFIAQQTVLSSWIGVDRLKLPLNPEFYTQLDWPAAPLPEEVWGAKGCNTSRESNDLI